jgi:hypothetical protein
MGEWNLGQGGGKMLLKSWALFAAFALAGADLARSEDSTLVEFSNPPICAEQELSNEDPSSLLKYCFDPVRSKWWDFGQGTPCNVHTVCRKNTGVCCTRNDL